MTAVLEFPECQHLTGRQREICEHKVLTPEKCDSFRVKLGIAPKFETSAISGPAVMVTKPPSTREPKSVNTDPGLGRFPGTNLALLLKACGIYVNDGCTCEEWIAKMNAWTIEENYAHRQEVIDHLKDRAKQEKMSVKKKFWTGVLIMWNGMLPMVSELVDEAIWQAKHHQK